MKINSKLGYNPVTFSELTKDDSFWKGCSTCVNYDVLTRTKRSHCLCTGMMYDPKKKSKIWDFMATKSILERLKQFKNNILLKKQPDNDDEK